MNQSNVMTVQYDRTGASSASNAMGMRPMQARAYDARFAQYLLLKSPPASGKSRALMFIALDKLARKQVSKVIIAVPERSIGKSFKNTDLTTTGFHSDWAVDEGYNLCLPGGEDNKTAAFERFMESDARILLCTHATLRFACSRIGAENFSNCLIGIDEFHHVSASHENKLGLLVRDFIEKSNVNIVAMTGSYFRGDSLPVLMPEDEAKFQKVTYNYYEQFNGYKYLKSLGIDFAFYTGKYTESIGEVLDTDKKTILHIPNVNSGESTKDKRMEVDFIIDSIGDVVDVDDFGIIHVRRADGKVIKIADLVNDVPSERERVVAYLNTVSSVDDIDLIIALGMAKEGFDWPFCEQTLTIGYRGSLTEITQIIGRCTRDSENKSHAQFTNLIAEPDADSDEVITTVNNILKAIAAALLMEQVMTPVLTFKAKKSDSDDDRVVEVKGIREPSTLRTKNIVENDLDELKARILQDEDMEKALSGVVNPEVVNKVLIPKIIIAKYPDLTEEETEEVREHIVCDLVIKNAPTFDAEGNNVSKPSQSGFMKLAQRLVTVEDLNIDLIDSVNPFQNAFDVVSKSLTPKLLKAVQKCIASFKISMTDNEARLLWPKINDFARATGRRPSLDSMDPYEKRLAEALVYIQRIKRENEYENNG
jgi:DEAD/DEAH box helicase-like protein